MVAVVVLLTALVVMLKFALVPAFGTFTRGGVTAAVLLLEVVITAPPDPATPTR